MEIKHSIDQEVFYDRQHALTRGIYFNNYSIEIHDHTYHEINIILSGSGIHTIESQTFSAEAGDVFVIPPGVRHGYKSQSDDFHVFHIIIKNQFFSKCESELNRFPGFMVLFEIEPFLRAQNRKTFLHLDSESLNYLKKVLYAYTELQKEELDETDILSSAEVFKIIGYLSMKMANRTFSAEAKGDYDSIAISQAIAYVHTNCSEKMTIDILAKRCNMSRATFIRKFKKVTNTTPNEYITSYRIRLAQRLLDLGKSKTTIAHECGFYDVSHMDKVLDKHRP